MMTYSEHFHNNAAISFRLNLTFNYLLSAMIVVCQRSVDFSIYRFSDWNSVSRAIPLSKYSQLAIEKSAMAALTKLCGDVKNIEPSIGCLGMISVDFELDLFNRCWLCI